MNMQINSILAEERGQETALKDDLELLKIMTADSRHKAPLYHPGPYWAAKARKAEREIKRYGIENFRGSTNLIGMSYTDNMYIDIRNAYNHGFRQSIRLMTKIYPLSMIFRSQVRLTESYARESLLYAQEILNIKEKSRNLLQKYRIPYSLLGKCLRKVKIEEQDYSIHYLNLLEQHDNIASLIKFNDAKSVFEIGGGFGANIHLLLENYKNIRKVLYLDISPNLYVGTQYLKAFYKNAVFDYRALRRMDTIRFSKDDKIEIFCITPWQIENFKGQIDILINAHSFVEMPKHAVENYVSYFNKFPGSANAAVTLTTYDGFDLNTTFHPNELPKFFKDRKFGYFEVETLLNPCRRNLFFISPGKLSF